MSFESDVKKLQKMYQKAQETKITLDFTDVLMSQYAQKIDDLAPVINVNYPLIDKGTTFQPMSILLNDPPVGNFLGIYVKGVQFDITINGIPGKYVPFVRFAFIVDDASGTSGQLNWFVNAIPTGSTASDLYDATWHVGYFEQGNYNDANPIPGDFNVKISLMIVNPAIAL